MLLIASVPIFVLVETVVLFSVWKFRMRPGEEEKDGPPIHGNTRLEVVWTAVPAMLIVALCTYAYTVLRSNEDSQDERDDRQRHRRASSRSSSPIPTADGKRSSPPCCTCPKGQPVVFKLRSLDVIHSFFVPNFSEKLDAVPGITTTLRVTPTRLGSYPVECTELCGAGHSLMRAAVHVVTPAAFQKWLQLAEAATRPPPVGTPPPNAAQPGRSGRRAARPRAASSSTLERLELGSQTSAAAGKAVFTGSAGCSTLPHARRRRERPAPSGRIWAPAIVPDAKKRRACRVEAVHHRRRSSSPTRSSPSGFQPEVMPQTFAQTLTQTQIQALVNFISSVTK